MIAQKRPPRILGSGHDIFWDWCAKGELRLQGCTTCGHIAWPVVEACEQCSSDALAWRPMSGRGTLVSWCRFERDYYAGLLPLPWDTILVELEEGPLFLSNPDGFGYEDCAAGIRLRLRFIPCEDDAGSFSLPVFALANAG